MEHEMGKRDMDRKEGKNQVASNIRVIEMWRSYNLQWGGGGDPCIHESRTKLTPNDIFTHFFRATVYLKQRLLVFSRVDEDARSILNIISYQGICEKNENLKIEK